MARVVFNGKLADVAGQYLRKGSQVYVEGSLKTRSWEKDGVKQYATEIRADQMQMLGSKAGNGDAGGAPAQRAAAPARAPAAAPAGDGYDDDSIPF